MSMTLEEITARIQSLHETSIGATWAATFLLVEARKFFDTTEQWVGWAKDSFHINRRNCFVKARVVDYMDDLQKVHARALFLLEYEGFKHPGISVERTEIISHIPADCLQTFVSELQEPLDLIDRDALRDAVAAFLGKPPRPRLVTYGKIPKPEQLLLGLDDPGAAAKIDVTTEAAYLDAHFRRLEVIAPTLSKDTLRQLSEGLREEINKIDTLLYTGGVPSYDPSRD